MRVKIICRLIRQTMGKANLMTQNKVTREHVRVLREADNPAAPLARLICRIEGNDDRDPPSASSRNGRGAAAD